MSEYQAEESFLEDLLEISQESNKVDNAEEEDSLSKNMQEQYEEHQKNLVKQSELNPQARPISSYQRNLDSGKMRKADDEEVVNVKPLIEALQDHIRNKITLSEFCDNPTLYLNEEEFGDLFRKVKFHLKPGQLSALFEQNNPFIKEGFIQIKKFVTNHELEFKEESRLLPLQTDEKKALMARDFQDLNSDIFTVNL